MRARLPQAQGGALRVLHDRHAPVLPDVEGRPEDRSAENLHARRALVGARDGCVGVPVGEYATQALRALESVESGHVPAGEPRGRVARAGFRGLVVESPPEKAAVQSLRGIGVGRGELRPAESAGLVPDDLAHRSPPRDASSYGRREAAGKGQEPAAARSSRKKAFTSADATCARYAAVERMSSIGAMSCRVAASSSSSETEARLGARASARTVGRDAVTGETDAIPNPALIIALGQVRPAAPRSDDPRVLSRFGGGGARYAANPGLTPIANPANPGQPPYFRSEEHTSEL